MDFTLEVEKSLRVLDGALVVLDASAGVEAQTLTVWRQANKCQTPCIAFLNKMDKNNADLPASLNSIRSKLGIAPVLLQVGESETTTTMMMTTLTTTKTRRRRPTKTSHGQLEK